MQNKERYIVYYDKEAACYFYTRQPIEEVEKLINRGANVELVALFLSDSPPINPYPFPGESETNLELEEVEIVN